MGRPQRSVRKDIRQPIYPKYYPQRVSFLGIPGELRNAIYSFLFTGPTTDKANLNYLLTCRQIYHEAVVPAFSSTHFVVNTNGTELSQRLSVLSEEQKRSIQYIERPGTTRRGLCFYLAIEKHLRPSCLITETEDVANLLSAIVRIESLTQVFAYSRDGNSMERLNKFNYEMMACSIRLVSSLKDILGTPRSYGYTLGNAQNGIVVDTLHSGSKSFALRIRLGAQDRIVTVSVPGYSLRNGTWEAQISGLSS
jgi:hypothetical protein